MVFKNLLLGYCKIFSEQKTKQIFEYIIKHQDTFMLDVGAWIGDTCIPLKENNNDKLQIIAVEPSPRHINFMKKKNKDIIYINKCLSDINNEILYPQSNIGILGDVAYGKEQKYKNKKGIKTITIDKLFKKYPKLNLIHLDVEGYEYKCLLAAEKLIKKETAIFVVEILDSEKNKKKIIKLFDSYKKFKIPEKIGFNFLNIINIPGEKGNGYNYIFFPKSFPKTKRMAKKFNLINISKH